MPRHGGGLEYFVHDPAKCEAAEIHPKRPNISKCLSGPHHEDYVSRKSKEHDSNIKNVFTTGTIVHPHRYLETCFCTPARQFIRCGRGNTATGQLMMRGSQFKDLRSTVTESGSCTGDTTANYPRDVHSTTRSS